MSVNVFIINSNETSRNVDMNVCLMIRDVRVYGCQSLSDAVLLSETVVADFVFIRLFPNDTNPCCYIKEIIDNHKHTVVVVSTYEVKDGHTIENQCKNVGVSSFFIENISKDKFLYVVKNYTDIIKRKKYKSEQDRLLLSTNSNIVSFIYEITGYNDILSMNKQIGSLNLKNNFHKDLIFIRIFSFLYDFLVKCFLSDIKINICFVADSNRIILIFQNDNKIDEILKNAVFYSVSKDYVSSDDNFTKIYIDLNNNEYMPELTMPTYRNITSINFNQFDMFEKVVSNLNLGMIDIEPLINLSDNLGEYFEIFKCLSDYLKDYTSSIEIEYIRDFLVELSREIDTYILTIVNEVKNDNKDNIFIQENNLYESVMKFKIMLNMCNKNNY